MKNIANTVSVDTLVDAGLASHKISVKWTGHWPCLCSGEWIITIDGQQVKLPEDVRSSDMNTYGTYSRWHFGEDWEEIWESYVDGLTFEPWLAENSWVKDLSLSSAEEQELYDAISEQDWRHGCCGGCI
jgi:hypothetical protein